MAVSSIKEPDIAAAAAMGSLDAAALHLQKLAGITEGDIAGISLSEKEWTAADETGRVKMLKAWLENEAVYEKD
jgi:hypothetical protein